MKVLIIAPHPDDEIPLAGQLILNNPQHTYYVAYITNGDIHNKETTKRLKEAIKATAKFGIITNNIFFLGYADSGNAKQHIYNSPLSALKPGISGKKETYSIIEKPEYCFQKLKIHHSYTKENLLQDLSSLILDIRADVIITTAFDEHPDHIATSLFVETILGNILNSTEYKPLFFKKFAYKGVWDGKRDFFSFPPKPTAIVKSNLEPYLTSENAIYLPVTSNSISYNLNNNEYFKIANLYKSQLSFFYFLSVANSDYVFWNIRTDNLLYNAHIKSQTEGVEYLTDFIKRDFSSVIDCTIDLTKQWKGTELTIIFDKLTTVSKIVLYSLDYVKVFLKFDNKTSFILDTKKGNSITFSPIQVKECKLKAQSTIAITELEMFETPLLPITCFKTGSTVLPNKTNLIYRKSTEIFLFIKFGILNTLQFITHLF